MNALSDDVAEREADLDILEARIVLYRFLSLSFSDPISPHWRGLTDPALCEAAHEAWDCLVVRGGGVAGVASGEVEPCNSPRLDWSATHAVSQNAATQAYERIFGLVMSKECPPCETEYSPETFSISRSHSLADIAGFYAAFGLGPSRAFPERPDHIGVELEFMAWLTSKELAARLTGRHEDIDKADICRDAQKRFLQDHLAWWAPAFVQAVFRRIDSADILSTTPSAIPLAQAARLLAMLIPIERLLFAIPVPDRLLPPKPNCNDLDSDSCDGCGLAGG